MKKYWILLISILSLSMAQNASEWRIWTSSTGTEIKAKIINENATHIQLELEIEGRKITLKKEDLSEKDRIFLQEKNQEKQEEKGNTTIEGFAAIPGQISKKIQCSQPGDEKWSYYVYLPTNFHDKGKYPVWYVMSSGGGTGGKGLKRYIAGAEQTQAILVMPNESKNGFADSDLAIEAAVRDIEQKLPVITSLKFSSGMSGGSRMAYWLAESNLELQGVLACGSGNGVYIKNAEFRDAKLRKDTYVYSLIGTHCFNRAEAIDAHARFPEDYQLKFFKGGHTWAQEKFITPGMLRVYGEALLRSSIENSGELRYNYAKKALATVEKNHKNELWEKYQWMKFLAKFEDALIVKKQALETITELESNPQIQLANSAQQSLKIFYEKHYKDIDWKSMKEVNEAREKEAAELIAQYKSTPQETLFKLLAEPAKMPKGY